jgi:hypothetical protein
MNFWFAPGSAAALGFCRLVFVAMVLYSVPIREFGAWADLPAAMWEPVPALRWLGLTPMAPYLLDRLGVVLGAALISAALGFLTRTSCAVAALLSLYLFGLQQSFGGTHHGTTVVPLALVTMAVARSGDACSVDALLRRASGRGCASRSVAPGEYTWPIQLMRCLTVLVFFAAGVAKLRHSGVAWVLSDNLRTIMVAQHLPADPATDLGLRMAQYPGFCMATAAIVLAAETLAPLALISVAARWVLVPVLFLFVLSLPAIFGFGFRPLLGLFVFWLPWRWLLRRRIG